MTRKLPVAKRMRLCYLNYRKTSKPFISRTYIVDETAEANHVHKKVMNTRDMFINSDDFDHDEALEAAVHVDKRKFLLKRLLKDNRQI